MNFYTFGVESTNIFPAANSKAGGQLLTEHNIKCRESVMIPLNIKYICGSSYVHCEDDFKVSAQTNDSGRQVATSVLEIAPGRGVIDGHYVESVTPMIIDMAEANVKAAENDLPELKGKLSIGFRMMYSTETTIAGSLDIENAEGVYEGIQVVILPTKEFITPLDSPSDRNKVTAHIRLADFSYVNGAVTTPVNNLGKCKFIPPERLLDATSSDSDVYVRRDKLKFGELYTMSGKNPNIHQVQDTWCVSTGSLMIWDRLPVRGHDLPSVREATFIANSATGQTQLVMPHQQIDGMVSTDGRREYYQDKILSLPIASFGGGTPGTVDKNYTAAVKQVLDKVNNVYRLPNGKQIGCIETLDDKKDLPTMRDIWNIGDYILVRQDNTLLSDTVESEQDEETSTTPPSTMYVVSPGYVKRVQYAGKNTIPSSLKGIELQRVTYNEPNENQPFEQLYVPGAGTAASDAEDNINRYFNLSDEDCNCDCAGCQDCEHKQGKSRGEVNKDYFTVVLPNSDDPENPTYYYYKVSKAGNTCWSNPYMITGEIPFASETLIGGFLDVPDTYTDSGYVKLDENGNLRLLDYGLLRSGVLAYQLGEDFEVPANLSATEIQSILDEYVNDRVVFPNSNQLKNSTNPNVITVKINLAQLDEDITDEQTPIVIRDVDSRFEGILHLVINGNADYRTVISVVNCKRIKITDNTDVLSDPETVTGPTINLYNSNLCYDAVVMNRLKTVQNLGLWYQKVKDTDPNLVVAGMTVQEQDVPIIPQNISYWTQADPNDYHYMYALQSLTFGSDGTIIGCGLYVCNHSTTNVDFTDPTVVVSKFSLPQTLGLAYPEKRLTHKLKVTGTFVSAYGTDGGFMVENTSFTAITQKYDKESGEETASGTISFFSQPTYVANAQVHNATEGGGAISSIDGWENNTFHIFYGGVTEQ